MALRRMSIRRTIVLLALLSSLLGLAATFTAVLVYDYYNLRQLHRDELATLAAMVANDLSEDIVRHDTAGAQDHLQHLSEISQIDLACVYQYHGNEPVLLTGTDNSTLPCPDHPEPILPLWASQPIRTGTTADSAPLGHLTLYRTGNRLLQPLLINGAVYLAVMLAGIALAALAARLLAHRMLVPLHELIVAAKEVATNHAYTLRAQEYGNNEMGALARAFNQMLSVIEEDNQRLMESERRFRLISERSHVGILQFAADGRAVYVNDEMLRITTMAREEVSVERLISLVHPDDRRHVKERIRHLRDQGEEISLDCCLYLPNGDIRWISGHMIPLSIHDGSQIGFLGTISDITELRTAYDQLEQMAFYDLLTGLANRRLFRDRLEHMLANVRRSGGGFTLILLDLDHFKLINDTLGHDAGDLLLSVVAERLKQCVRFTDTVARLGGDEFAVILPNIDETLAASAIAKKILNALARPVLLDAHEISVRASLGLSIAPTDTDNAETLIKYADLALYRAKDDGRNRFQFYTSEMNTLLIEHLRLVQDLRHAIEHRAFALCYQPQVHLATGELVGFEALLRWRHPKRGDIPPQSFIPVAEENHLIIPLGRWILETACAQMSALCRARLVSRRAVMTVNLSIHQLHDPDFIRHLGECLQHHSLRPAQLELELAESVLMKHLDDSIHLLQDMQTLGVSLAIDDFGTGYSSLGHLKRLPVNVIKVDRSFVTDIPHERDDMEVTAAVIAMAHKLRYKVVAEGIESSAQYQFLREAGCDFGQGHFIGHPMPPAELMTFCEDYQHRLEAELTTRKP